MAVEITLTNTHAWLTSATEDEEEALSKYWSYSAPGARFTLAYRNGWNGRIRLLKRNTIPAGLFRATKKEIRKELGIRCAVTYDRPGIHDFLPGIELSEEKYRYQDECVDAMCKALRRGGGIVLAATGSGKTALAAKFFSRLQYRCLFVVDQLDLLYQSQNELMAWLQEKVGVVGDASYRPDRVTVATIQTLHKHIDDLVFRQWYKQVQVVVVDELHEQINRRNFDVLHTIRPLARYGLTATLELQKKHVRMRAYAFAGPVLYRFPITEGIERKVLSNGRVLQLLFPALPFEEDDYQELYKQQVVDNVGKMAACRLLADNLTKCGRYVLVLVDRVQHLKDLSGNLELAGIEHRLAYGAVDQVQRYEAKEQFEAGDIRCIVANKVFRKGVSIKRIDAMIDVAEMQSKSGAVQKFGRGIRLHPEKDELLYLDIGTDGDNRFHKAARSRARAFRAAGIRVRITKVHNAAEAWAQVKKELAKIQKDHSKKMVPEQQQLSLLRGTEPGNVVTIVPEASQGQGNGAVPSVPGPIKRSRRG